MIYFIFIHVSIKVNPCEPKWPEEYLMGSYDINTYYWKLFLYTIEKNF